ncbi:MAG: AraC family transcriptional regulator [Sphingobacteriales bacterium]|nr:MAG: AraC family transcriptional regulator [Sphingobacteriales bacterium]
MLQVKVINAVGDGRMVISQLLVRSMLFFISGTGQVLIAGKRLEIVRGRVFFLEDGDTVILESATVVSGFLVGFEKLLWEGFLLHYPRYSGCSVFKSLLSVDVAGGEVLVLIEELRWLKAEMESGANLIRLKLRFNLVMLVVLDRVCLGEKGKWDQLRAEFLEVLEGNFRLQRKSGFYADRLGMTSRKLNGLCREWFEGRDFVGVHRERLIGEAEYLLIETDRAIKEIAFDLGFCSQQHFRGYFFRVKGMSPSCFRNRL